MDYGSARQALLDRFAPGARVRRIAWKGRHIDAVELGVGPPLLYVHGVLSSGAEIVPVMARLARGFHVVAVDQPGHGGSDAFDYGQVDVHAVANDWLAAVVGDLDLGQPDMLSNSLGNLLAGRYMARQRTGRVVCLGATPALGGRAPFFPFGLFSVPGIGRIASRLALASPSPSSSRKFWRQVLVASDAGLSDELMACDVANVKKNRDSMRSLLHAVAARGGIQVSVRADEAWEVLADRCLMLWGSDDSVGSADVARHRFSNGRGPLVVDVPGAGHLPWLDQPDAVAHQIKDFLSPNAGHRS